MNAEGGTIVDPTRNMLNYGPSAAPAPFKSFISKSCHDPVLSSGKILSNLVSSVPGLPLLRGRNSLWQCAQIRFDNRRIGTEFSRDTFHTPSETQNEKRTPSCISRFGKSDVKTNG